MGLWSDTKIGPYKGVDIPLCVLLIVWEWLLDLTIGGW